jgi:hypothetical protein
MDKKALFALFTLMAISSAVMGLDIGTDINDSLMLLVSALPIITLAVTGIVGIIVALVAVVILVLLIGWFKEILMLPLDIVKRSMGRVNR